jgi:hypothetical protein
VSARVLRLVSVPTTGAEMATKKTALAKTKTPCVYRQGKKYVYAYRVRSVQRWKTVDTYDEARRGTLAAEVDVERGELRDLARVSFGDCARNAGARCRRSQGRRRGRRPLGGSGLRLPPSRRRGALGRRA